MEVGEKYLTISILGQVKVNLFPNKNKKAQTDPDFIGNGVACWINAKKPPQAHEIKPAQL